MGTMDSFSDFITEQKNTHMTHVEDKLLYGGVKGTRQAINALRSLRDMLQGSGGSISVKWDGAPAIFCGTDPSDGEFFVAKKGIFAKNPKVYKTNADIEADTSGDLATKLKLALKHLPALNIKGVIQGDFLFSKSDLGTQTYVGEDFLTFHPNTIVYAVPKKSQAAKDIKAAKIGIVWHTTYSGKSFESMKASFGVNVKGLTKSKAVWSQDAILRDLTNATLTQSETENINEHLSKIGKLFNTISGTSLRELEADQVLAQHIEQFNNTYVRKGEIIKNTKTHTAKLVRWIKSKYEKEADKRSTDKGKKVQKEKAAHLLKFFSPANTKRNKVLK